MNVFVVWQVDQIEGIISSSFMADNVVELRRSSQDLAKAASIIKAWAIAHGGSGILDMVSIGAFEVPADKMNELPEVRRRFELLTDKTLSVGVGMDLPEAYKAMKFASDGGGSKISLYTEEMEAEQMGKSLAKNGKVGTESAVGFAQEQPDEAQSAPAEQAPPEASASAGPAPAAPGGAPQQEGDPQQGGQPQDPRAAIVQALQEVKANAEAIEALKQSNPQAYDAIKDVVQAMIMMAQGMMQDQGGGDVQKSEPDRPDLNKEVPPGFSEGAMLALKEKHGEKKAFKIAWAAHNKHKKKVEELEKEGPMPHKTPKKIHMKYPDALPAIGSTAGTINEGKIKVAPIDPATGAPDGQGWNGGRAGLIMSPKGSAVSSRQPGSE